MSTDSCAEDFALVASTDSRVDVTTVSPARNLSIICSVKPTEARISAKVEVATTNARSEVATGIELNDNDRNNAAEGVRPTELEVPVVSSRVAGNTLGNAAAEVLVLVSGAAVKSAEGTNTAASFHTSEARSL